MVISLISSSKTSPSPDPAAPASTDPGTSTDPSSTGPRPTATADEFSRVYNPYADASTSSIDSYKRNDYYQFHQSYGKYLLDIANQFHEAGKLTGNDKEYQKKRLESALLGEFARLLNNESNLDYRLFLDLVDHHYDQAIKTQFPAEENHFTSVIDQLRKEFISSASPSLQGLTIPKRDADGKVIKDQTISLAEIFSSHDLLKKYIQDPKVRDALLYTYDNLVAPKLSQEIATREKTASEEVKSIIAPTIGLAAPFLLARGGRHAYHTILDNQVHRSYRSFMEGTARNVMTGGIKKNDMKAAADLVAERMNQSKRFSQLMKEGKISTQTLTRLTNKAVEKVAYQQLQKTASAGIFGNLFKLSNTIGRGVGIGGRFLGLAGGPWTMALTIAAPFLFEIIMAEGKDFLDTIKGQEIQTKNDWVDSYLLGVNGLGDVLGGFARGYAKYFNLA